MIRHSSFVIRHSAAALAVCLLLASSAAAQFDWLTGQRTLYPAPRQTQQQPSQTPHPAVVRVISPERNGASLGSGTLVDVSERHGLVITNWHVVKDAAGNVIVSFPDGFQSPGYVLKMDRDWDLAAVAIWKPASVQPVPIAADVPRPGDVLTICGYGSGRYLAQSGRFVQYLSPATGWPAEIVEIGVAARHGDSGGPMLNSRGELAGVLFGEGGGATSGSHCGRVREFLASIMTPKSPSPSPSPAPPANDFLAQAPATAASSPKTQAPSPVAYPSTGVPAPRLPAQTANIAAPPLKPLTASLPPPLPLEGQPGPSIKHEVAAKTTAPPLVPLPTTATPPSADPNAQQIAWEDFAGHTIGEQLKTVLAAVGALLIVLQLAKKSAAAA